MYIWIATSFQTLFKRINFFRDEYAFHLVIELYDRGNVVLTESDYTILNLLRQRTDKNTEERYAVKGMGFNTSRLQLQLIQLSWKNYHNKSSKRKE